MNDDNIDVDRVRREVPGKCHDVALEPGRAFGFCAERPWPSAWAVPRCIIGALPGRAVGSFAGVGSPFALRPL